MASLTLTEKSEIRQFLGWPDGFRQKNTRLESVMDNLSDESIPSIQSALAKIIAVDTALTNYSLTQAGIRKVDEIEFWEHTRLQQLLAAGKRAINQLSIILGVPVNAPYFGTGGYPGDSFMPGLGGGSRGGPIRLG